MTSLGIALRVEDLGDGAKDEVSLGDQVNPDLFESLLVFVETSPGGPVRLASSKEYVASNTGPDGGTVLKFGAPVIKDALVTIVLPIGG
jgi:hypothetical protein